MTDFQRSLRPQWQDIPRHWQERPMLRMATWAICALSSLHLVMLSQTWREVREEEYRRLSGELLKLQEVSRQTAWPERAMQAEDALERQRERLWLAPNASLARADIQAWLGEQVRKSGLQEAKVDVLAPQGFEEQGAVARIEAQVRGRLDPASFSQLLYALEAEPRQVSVDFLELNNMVSPALNLQLSFYLLPKSPRTGP